LENVNFSIQAMKVIHFYRTEFGACPVEEFDVVPVQYFKKLVNTDDL
jgi:hypothetical protein